MTSSAFSGPCADARSWMIAFGLSLGAAVAGGYGRFAYGLILPAMRADLHWTYTEAGWINTANALGYFLGSAATLATIRVFGNPALFVGGVILTTLSLIMTGIGDNIWVLSLWRLLAGVGGAPVFIAGGALAAGLFRRDPSLNATSIAVFFGGGGLGVLLSGLLLPAFFDRFGASAWHQAWWLLAGLATVSSLGALAAVRAAGETLAPSSTATEGPPRRLPIARMAPSLVGYTLFALGYIIYFTFLVAWMRTRAIPTGWVVATWSALGVGAMAGPLVWRRLLTHFDTGRPLSLACAATGLATALPLVSSGRIVFVASALLFGVAFFNAPSAVTNFSRKNLDPKSWGPSVALYTTLFAVGQTIGPVGAGFLTDATGDLGSGFIAGALILFAGAAASEAQRKIER